ncbi:D-ribose pyranase [Bacillus altitudinis]|uniref:D-ribose pyranase n=1 Tax=Bacillus altitudinis TaxID=293387 RepID=UPI0022832674|nr:D-ribose pyranase [Bacillus altitudinis]MCY7693397.1 D-ribose pyranase [Bacillus altitudinis]
MKKNGILNSHIAKVLADLGHTDTIVIADCGLPIPEGPVKIDLALSIGTPSFQEVTSLLLEEMAVEHITIASEIKEANERNHLFLKKAFSHPLDEVDHETFKDMTKQAKAVIRTGEATPYANCILHAGVIF